ncbi:hypothetical protein EXU57_21900 [Segetibacter sp. 3557_3]|uniref:outer membrane beta-barrel protein n=1 Tax=Segetibacter sp. 3557_3 TaxID=2547429 RepID=UPI0010590451|nr:hypothetical protein EXU57_21900 [Segetibacter sp. 3557_3]
MVFTSVFHAADLYCWHFLRYEGNKWVAAARAEYYSDKAGVIVPPVNAQPFQMRGYSLNIDRKITDNAIWRIEFRMLHNSSPYFKQGNRFASTNFFATTSFVIDLVN